MKKYDIQLLINPMWRYSHWKGFESDSAPKKENEGVLKIGDVYYNSINIDQLIVVENHQP